MPKLAKPLSDTQIRRARPGAKPLKLYDGRGLYLEILPAGSRFWRYRHRQPNGKESSITFGSYPELSLADARRKCNEARRQSAEASAHSFRQVATEWHALKAKSWSPAYAKNVLHRLELDIFPHLGKTPVALVSHHAMASMNIYDQLLG